MLEGLLKHYAKSRPVRVIDGDTGEPYLRRYFVAAFGGWRIYLHHFLASDPDRGVHSHPFAWSVALPLVGGYHEQLIDGYTAQGIRYRYQRRLPFLPNFIGRNKFHRVIIAPGCTGWSLFLHAPHIQTWGFMTDRPYKSMKGAEIKYIERYPPTVTKWWQKAPKGYTLEEV